MLARRALKRALSAGVAPNPVVAGRRAPKAINELKYYPKGGVPEPMPKLALAEELEVQGKVRSMGRRATVGGIGLTYFAPAMMLLRHVTLHVVPIVFL